MAIVKMEEYGKIMRGWTVASVGFDTVVREV